MSPNPNPHDLATNVAHDVETGTSEAADPALAQVYRTFIKDHTDPDNIALIREIAQTLEDDGYVTEARAWTSQANMLEVLGAFHADTEADGTPNDLGTFAGC